MKGLIIIISCVLLVFLILEKSGALVTVSYKTREGVIQVEHTRWEWHPEKIAPYLKGLYKKYIESFLKKFQS